MGANNHKTVEVGDTRPDKWVVKFTVAGKNNALGATGARCRSDPLPKAKAEELVFHLADRVPAAKDITMRHYYDGEKP